MTLTAAQVRQACILLRWGPSMLVQHADVSFETVRRACEDGGVETVPSADLRAIRTALERAGVRFITDDTGRPGAESRVKAP